MAISQFNEHFPTDGHSGVQLLTLTHKNQPCKLLIGHTFQDIKKKKNNRPIDVALLNDKR